MCHIDSNGRGISPPPEILVKYQPVEKLIAIISAPSEHSERWVELAIEELKYRTSADYPPKTRYEPPTCSDTGKEMSICPCERCREEMPF